jgi:hypothetical protein
VITAFKLWWYRKAMRAAYINRGAAEKAAAAACDRILFYEHRIADLQLSQRRE